MKAKPTYEELEQRVRELDLVRLRHGIEFNTDPVKLDESAACAEIARLWKDESCQAAKIVLRQFCSTHQDLNHEWALHMVKAANDKRAEVEEKNKLLREGLIVPRFEPALDNDPDLPTSANGEQK